MMNIFNYRRLWKSQRNKNKILTKKINKMQSGYFEEFKDDEIERLKGQAENLEKRLLRVNLEAQKYFDIIAEMNGQNDLEELKKWIDLELEIKAPNSWIEPLIAVKEKIKSMEDKK